MRAFCLVCIGLSLLILQSGAASATVLPVPDSLARDVLSEAVPTAFSPADFEISDFQASFIGPTPPGATLSFARDSLQWVRVSDVLVLPRGRLVVELKGVQSGSIANVGFSQPLAVLQDGTARAELPVALLSNAENVTELKFRTREGMDRSEKIRIAFEPRGGKAQSNGQSHVLYDTSCTRFNVHSVSKNPTPEEWMYVGCRMVNVYGEQHRTSSLEVFVYWNGVGDKVSISGADTRSASPGLWPLRLRSEPNSVVFKHKLHEVRLFYGTPENLHLGNIGFGIGPYSFQFSGQGEDTSMIVPLLTIYGSYFVNESMRMVAFDATAFSSQLYTDFGIYLNTEYIKILDRRLTINIMLGAHVVGFRSGDQHYGRFGAPQGAELIFSDALLRGYNLSAGGFLYPEISGKAYNNVWLRYGSSKFFAELNYISWREQVGESPFYSRSVGVSVGFPLLRVF